MAVTWRGTEVQALGKNLAKTSLFGRPFLVSKGEGRQQGNDCSGHNSLRSLGTAPSTETKYAVMTLRVSDTVLIQVRRPQSALSPRGTVLLLMENMSYLYALSAERDKHQDIYRRIACRGSFLALLRGLGTDLFAYQDS